MDIEQRLLTINPYSRPATLLRSVKGIVVHWIATPKGIARGVYNYFEARKSGTNGYGSAHFCIDLDGKIIQMLPDHEMAYHVGAKKYIPNAIQRLSSYPNNCTLGIECCHLNWDGEMTPFTYNKLIDLCVFLLGKYGLDENDLWLHSEITGKNCHRWFVNNPNEWVQFKQIVGRVLRGDNLANYYKNHSINSNVLSPIQQNNQSNSSREIGNTITQELQNKEQSNEQVKLIEKVEPIVIENKLEQITTESKIDNQEKEKLFNDIPEQMPFLLDAATRLYNHKIIVGDGKGNIMPNSTITRAELILIIDRLFRHFELKQSTKQNEQLITKIIKVLNEELRE